MEMNAQIPGFDGIYLIDKEQDWTSFDVVAKLRNTLHIKKVGHAGTLDPMATGLLIVLAGRATKLSDELMHRDKEYYCTLRLGIKTDTQDIWGTVLSEKTDEAASVTDSLLETALEKYTGDIMQVPPMYSAIKIKGRKLYEIARKGGEVEREARPVRISCIELLGRKESEAYIRVECSSGTYIRTLCSDIGDHLGCGGCMSALRRTRIGEYSVENARKVAQICAGDTDPTIKL